jgi:hypothetical protein
MGNLVIGLWGIMGYWVMRNMGYWVMGNMGYEESWVIGNNGLLGYGE